MFTPTGASRFRPGPYPDHNPDTKNHSCRVLLAETYPPVPMVIPAASLVLLGTSEGQVGGKQSPRPTAASSHWTHGRNRSRGRAWEPWQRLRGRKCHGWGGMLSVGWASVGDACEGRGLGPCEMHSIPRAKTRGGGVWQKGPRIHQPCRADGRSRGVERNNQCAGRRGRTQPFRVLNAG